MSVNIDSLFKNADPVVSDILNKALSEKEISAEEGLALYDSEGMDFHLVGMAADELRRRRVGNIVTYVVNRNINFTNVCIKQCGFCAFSRHSSRSATRHGRRFVRKYLQSNKKRDSKYPHSWIFP
jgi:FO synthase subunit 2